MAAGDALSLTQFLGVFCLGQEHSIEFIAEGGQEWDESRPVVFAALNLEEGKSIDTIKELTERLDAMGDEDLGKYTTSEGFLVVTHDAEITVFVSQDAGEEFTVLGQSLGLK